ncbi:MAG: hypothetical protein ACOVLE_02285, partial [Pirellula staleyi]
GGLFWHTAHYHDAATCSHRSYSVKMRGKSIEASGGGPANEHNYASGLLLYYQLSGNVRARDAVIGLAEWVRSMDDGNQHLLGFVTGVPTGLASCTRNLEYQGPGRGAGNSMVSLVNAWQASEDTRYLDYAAELIYRTIHPDDNVQCRQLLDSENHWSYTVYLQALVYFIFVTQKIEGYQAIRDYARASFFQYARWMVENERPYLDHAQNLEYPTETWAAQDIRKGVVLLMAAWLSHCDEEKLSYSRKGCWLLENAWTALMSFPSRGCTRPLAIVLQQCYLQQYFESDKRRGFRWEVDFTHRVEFRSPSEFVPQKSVLRNQLGSPGQLITALRRISILQLWISTFRRSWIVARIRNLI